MQTSNPTAFLGVKSLIGLSPIVTDFSGICCVSGVASFMRSAMENGVLVSALTHAEAAAPPHDASFARVVCVKSVDGARSYGIGSRRRLPLSYDRAPFSAKVTKLILVVPPAYNGSRRC